MEGRTDEQMNGRTKVSLCSTRLCPLWGRCPKNREPDRRKKGRRCHQTKELRCHRRQRTIKCIVKQKTCLSQQDTVESCSRSTDNLVGEKKSKSVFDFLINARETGFSLSFGEVGHLIRLIVAFHDFRYVFHLLISPCQLFQI